MEVTTLSNENPIEIEVSDFHIKSRSRFFSSLRDIDFNKLTNSLFLKYTNSSEFLNLTLKEGIKKEDIKTKNISCNFEFMSERVRFKTLIKNLEKNRIYNIFSKDSFIKNSFPNLDYTRNLFRNLNICSSDMNLDIEDIEQLNKKKEFKFLNSKNLIRLGNSIINYHTNDSFRNKTERREEIFNIYPLIKRAEDYMKDLCLDEEVVFTHRNFKTLSIINENKKVFLKEINLFKKYKKSIPNYDGWGMFSFVTKGHKRKIKYSEYKFNKEYLDYDFNNIIYEKVIDVLSSMGKDVSSLTNLIMVCPDWDISNHIINSFMKDHKTNLNYSSIFIEDLILGWNPMLTMLDFLYKPECSILIKFDSFPYFEVFVII